MTERDDAALAARQWMSQRRSPEKKQSQARRSRGRSTGRTQDDARFLTHAPLEAAGSPPHRYAVPIGQAPTGMSGAYAAAAAQASMAKAAALQAQVAASPAGSSVGPAADLDDACLQLDDVLGRVGAALRAVNEQYLESQLPAQATPSSAASAQTAGPRTLDPVASDEAAALADLAGLDSKLGELQSRAVRQQEEQRQWRQFFMRADVGGRGTAHRDDLLALLASGGLSILGAANTSGLDTLQRALGSSDEAVTLQQFMAQVRISAGSSTPSSPTSYQPVQQSFAQPAELPYVQQSFAPPAEQSYAAQANSSLAPEIDHRNQHSGHNLSHGLQNAHAGKVHLSHGARSQREHAAELHAIKQMMHSKRKLHGHTIADSRAVFAAIDRDHSGTLDFAEFGEAMHRLGLGLNKQQLDSLAQSMNHDGDGSINYQEMLSFLHGDATHSDDQTVAMTATPPGVSQARDRVEAVLNDDEQPGAYDIEALRQAFAMYCESGSSVGKTKWMTNPKFMRMMRDSGVIRTRAKPAGSGGGAAAGAAPSMGPSGLPKAQIDVIFAKALRIGKQQDGKGPPNMAQGKSLGFDGFVCALHSLAVHLFFPGSNCKAIPTTTQLLALFLTEIACNYSRGSLAEPRVDQVRAPSAGRGAHLPTVGGGLVLNGQLNVSCSRCLQEDGGPCVSGSPLHRGHVKPRRREGT